MSKETNKDSGNPFGGFSVIKGEFKTPEGESTEPVKSDIITGDETIIKEKDQLEAERIAEGDKALEKVIAKTTKTKTPEIEEIEEVEEEITNEEPEEDEIKSGIKEFVNTLYNKQVIDFDTTDEDFDESEEGVEKLIDKTVSKRIDNWASSLHPDFQKLLEYTEAGGNPKDFLNVYYGNHSWETFKVETEESQKTAAKEYLLLTGDSLEEAEEKVTEWFDNGTLEKHAKSALTKLQKHESTEKAQLVEIAKQKDAERKKQEKEYFENFKKELYSKDDILGFKLTPKVKDKLWEFMTVPDRSGKTGYDKALESNKDAQYLFALQSMNGFDITKLEKQVETKVTKKVNNIFKNYSTSSKAKISSGSTEEIQEENPFAAFKKIK